MIEDGAPYHGSNVVKDFKSANLTLLTIERLLALMKYFKTFEDLHDSVITTFKTYLQDASKVLCVMKKCARILRLLLNGYRSELEIIYLRNYIRRWVKG